MRPGHGVRDRLGRASLRRRRLERQRGEDPVGEGPAGHVLDAPARALDPALPERDAQLEGEQLIELQPVGRRRELALVLREVDPPDRGVEIEQPLAADHVGRDGIGDSEAAPTRATRARGSCVA